jgi:hypothetical protein
MYTCVYVRFWRQTASDSPCSIHQLIFLMKAHVYSVRYELNPYLKYTLILVIKGRIRAQAVSRLHLASGARFQSPASPRGIHAGKSGTLTCVPSNNLLLRCRLPFHLCCWLILICMLLLVEAQICETWEHCEIAMLFQQSDTIRRMCTFAFSLLKG